MFTAREWLIEARDRAATVLRGVHGGFLGENGEAEYNGLTIAERIDQLRRPARSRTPADARRVRWRRVRYLRNNERRSPAPGDRLPAQ